MKTLLVKKIQEKELIDTHTHTHTHMRMLRGSPRARKPEQNLFTETNELISVSNIIISAFGLSFCITSFTPAAFVKSLAGITILIPFLASALAVSTPIPDVAPLKKKKIKIKILSKRVV